VGTKSTSTVTINGQAFTTYTYTPSGPVKGVILSHHGSGRDASGACDAAVQIADERGLMVIAPYYDSSRFDSDLYHYGGVIDNGRLVADSDDWTANYAAQFAQWGLNKAGLTADNAEVILYGHSAGGQHVSRVAAFAQNEDIFDRIIVSNPSTHVWPSTSTDFKAPHGFGGSFFPADATEAMLKDYLRDKVTIYLGALDNDLNASDLATGTTAMRQGDDRLERGINAFNAAKALAESKGWDFGWDLVIAPNAGHDSYQMLKFPAMREAILAPEANDTTPAPTPTPTPEPTPDPVPPAAGKTYDFDTISGANTRALITDYVKGDVFDFSTIDADTGSTGNQAFRFLGKVPSSAFTTNGDEIRYGHDTTAGTTNIYLNNDRDTGYEARVEIKGIFDFAASDFIL
jgi:hypothetical protein